jgi:hypothetical protein
MTMLDGSMPAQGLLMEKRLKVSVLHSFAELRSSHLLIPSG